MTRTASSIALALALALVACAGAGPYGYAVQYVPTGDERAAVADAVEYDPVMAQRAPDEWRKKRVKLFGVVSARAAGEGGTAALTVGVRRLEARNLCKLRTDESTCRVTVSDKDFGVVHVLVKLEPDDDLGADAVAVGSLVRVTGKLAQQIDPNDGAPFVHADFYRHWPRFHYATQAAAEVMRQ